MSKTRQIRQYESCRLELEANIYVSKEEDLDKCLKIVGDKITGFIDSEQEESLKKTPVVEFKNFQEEKPKVEKPKVEKPEVEKPKVEKPKVEKPKVEKPKVVKPKVVKPKVVETGANR